jgi:hypothetical protein
MGKITTRDKHALNELVLDCTLYSFSEKEALEYIKKRFGKRISDRTYRRYKKNIDNGDVTQQWLNHFTKIGFLLHHKKQIDIIEKIQQDNMTELFNEIEKQQQRNEDKILKLKHDIRENVKLLVELGLGTPIISRIKADVDKTNNKYNEIVRKYSQLVSKVRIKNPELLQQMY